MGALEDLFIASSSKKREQYFRSHKRVNIDTDDDDYDDDDDGLNTPMSLKILSAKMSFYRILVTDINQNGSILIYSFSPIEALRVKILASRQRYRGKEVV